MNSERTRLSGAAIDLLVSVATGLGREFEQLLTLFMPPLLALCGRTNKVVINRARTCIITIIESTQLASVLSYFLQNIKDKSASLRLLAAEGTLACLNSCNPPDLERELRARDIEAIIRSTARDANAEVRRLSRKIFGCYKILLPGRVDRSANVPVFLSLVYVDTISPVSPHR
jgi:CLASP N terminal